MSAKWWFVFQEYSAEFNTIHHKEKKSKATDGVMLTSLQKNEPQQQQQPAVPQASYMNNAGSATPPPK